MKRKLPRLAALITALAVFAAIGVGAAFAFDSGGNPGKTGPNTITWTGQGASNGQVNTEQCDAQNDPFGANQPYLLWILTVDGGSIQNDSTTPVLHLGGTGSGDYTTTNPSDNSAAHFVTPYFTPDSSLTAYADINVLTTGHGSWNLVISHGCPGTTTHTADDLSVTKDANPSFTRTFKWTKIEKSVDNSTVYSAGGGESGKATYTVKVTHDSGTDSGWQVAGTIVVHNPNPDPVSGVNVTDTIDNNGNCQVTGGTNVTVPALGTTPTSGVGTITYVCTFSSNPGSGTNTAKATWPDIGSSHTSGTGTATYDFSSVDPTLVDNCISVSDSLDPNSPEKFCVGDTGEVDNQDGTFTFTYQYSATFKDPAGTCTDHKNTAVGTTGDTNTEVDSNEVTVSDCQGADLTVSKTAAGTYDRECSWKISKSASPTSQTVDVGADAKVYYEVDLNASCDTTKNVKVKGTITISNPNTWEAVTLDSLTDALDVSGGSNCTLATAGPYTVPAAADAKTPGTLQVNYTCDPASLNDTLNTATAKWNADTYHTPTGSASGTADVSFKETLIDDCVDVTDSLDSATPVSIGDGHYCVTRNDAGDLVGTSVVIKYTRTFKGPAAGTCATHNNKASFTDNSNPQVTKSATASVQVCSYNALTIGYWKNHLGKQSNPNDCQGLNLPSGTSCSSNGPWVKTKLPQNLGTYSVDTILKAANVFAANNCASATASDGNAVSCLAAQLLATELNVATFGGSCINATITDANTFLSTKVSPAYKGPGFAYTFVNGGTRAAAIALKTKLDNYNNGLGCI